MSNRDLLKEAIADAKAVKETAIANAKAALEEAFAPQLRSMLSAKLEEMEKEEVDEEIEEVATDISEESEEMSDELDLDAILAELEEGDKEDEDMVREADEDEVEDESAEEVETDEDDEEIDLEEMSEEDLAKFIEDVIADMVEGGELEAGENFEAEEEEGMESAEDAEGEEMEAAEEEAEEIMEGEKEEEKLEEGLLVDLTMGLNDAFNVSLTMGQAGLIAAAASIAGISGGTAILSWANKNWDKLKGILNLDLGDNEEGTESSLKDAATAVSKEEVKEEEEDMSMEEKLAETLDITVESATSLAVAATALGMKELNEITAWASGAIKERKTGEELRKDLEAQKNLFEREINELKAELYEVNLLNSKLLYTNKIFRGKTLKEAQKVKVLEAFDKAETVKEAKLIYETLNSEFTTKTKSQIKESLGAASKPAGVAPQVTKEPIVEIGNQVARWQRLAGIK